ncbi:MAG: hypothetical protein JNL64_01785 [Blastocatellia bacterium]|nr:hypothetical protein [Blastocatellia bacterium]
MNKLTLLFMIAVVTLLSSGALLGQGWESESPSFPSYNALLRRYKAAKKEIDSGNVGDARRGVILNELRTVRTRASALRANQQSTPNGNQELIARYNYFIDALNREITILEVAGSPTSLRLFKGKTAYSSSEEVTVLYKVQPNMRGKVWVALMRADEPRRDLAYTNSPVDLSRFLPKILDSRADGTFKYTAPSAHGDYEIRMFEKDRGQLLAQVAFRVQLSFLDELRSWRREIGNAFIQLDLKYGFNKIAASYVKAFEAAGANDFKGYSRDWSPSFWASHLSKDGRNATSVFYLNPLDKIDESIRNIGTFRKSYTSAEVEHYRNGMSRWRATYFRIPEFFDRLIAIEAEKNRDLKETGIRNANLRGDALENAEKQAARRSDDRMSRRSAIIAEINQFKKEPIFAFAAGSSNPR